MTSAIKKIRKKIEKSRKRFWHLSDFKKIPFSAKALSRLVHKGIIKRINRGLYSKSRFDLTKQNELRHSNGIFPAGKSAAKLLGFRNKETTLEVSTTGVSLPQKIIGKTTIIYKNRPKNWLTLSSKDVAILEFIRNCGDTSDLTPHKTVDLLLKHMLKPGQFDRVFKVFKTEPPRVKAILGAIGQEIGVSKNQLIFLRNSLNPSCRFNFGKLASLKYAIHWQAKGHKKQKSKHKRSSSYDESLVDELNDHEKAIKYLNTILRKKVVTKKKTQEFLLIGLRNVVEACGGIGVLSKKVKMSRITLYKMLSGEGNPITYYFSELNWSTGFQDQILLICLQS